MNLADYIEAIEHFPKPGIVFRDISPLLNEPAAYAHAVTQIASHWRGRVDAVVGLDARGFLFGASTAMLLAIPFVMVRKAGKLPGEVVGYSYELEYGSDTIEMKRDALAPGARVLVVDDLLATGGTAAAACALIESAGARVAGCAFVIELNGLGGRAKLGDRSVQSLLTYQES